MISHRNTDEYEVTDACPEAMQAGGKKEFDEAFEKWKVKVANMRPTWRWVEEDEE